MRQVSASKVEEIALPWSEGLLSAKISQKSGRTVAMVPELGLHCYGASQTEAVFRLFTSLLKYYSQLRSLKGRLTMKGELHLQLLSIWVKGIENKMKIPNIENKLLCMGSGVKLS
jgi:hypothetical protein